MRDGANPAILRELGLKITDEAAAEIERLRAEVERLRGIIMVGWIGIALMLLGVMLVFLSFKGLCP